MQASSALSHSFEVEQKKACACVVDSTFPSCTANSYLLHLCAPMFSESCKPKAAFWSDVMLEASMLNPQTPAKRMRCQASRPLAANIQHEAQLLYMLRAPDASKNTPAQRIAEITKLHTPRICQDSSEPRSSPLGMLYCKSIRKSQAHTSNDSPYPDTCNPLRKSLCISN